jgi:hypothetical protein
VKVGNQRQKSDWQHPKGRVNVVVAKNCWYPTPMGIDEAKRYRETSFGPLSEPIQSSEFAKNASTSVRGVTKELTALWKKTKKQTRDHVQAELRCVHVIITIVLMHLTLWTRSA